MSNRPTAFEKLQRHRSWSLQRVSPATYPGDVIATSHRRGERLSRREADAIVALIKSGSAYRCRIGKGRYVYGATAAAAIEGCLDLNAKKRKAKR